MVCVLLQKLGKDHWFTKVWDGVKTNRNGEPGSSYLRVRSGGDVRGPHGA